VIRVSVVHSGDPSTEGVLRPVNASLHGTSVSSRQLADEAGDGVERRLASVGDLPAGGAVITPAGNLPSSFLIHAVVQTPEEPVSEGLVRRALTNGLRRAEEWGLESLTVLPFGVGPGNLDADDAARITVSVLQDHAATADTLEEIVIAVATDYEADVFRRRIAQVFGEASPSA
jgi:O-acetyl-ADP-ribose deacetylase (regulator of RNase III)